MAPRIRVVADDVMGHHAHVHLVGEDGTEHEMSRCVQAVDLHLEVGEAITADLHLVLAGGDVLAEVETVVLKVLPRHLIPQVIQQLIEQFDAAVAAGEIAETTQIGDSWRRYALVDPA